MDLSLSKKQQKFLEGIDKVCQEIRPYEEIADLAEERNDRVIRLFGKTGMLSCRISKE